MLDDDGVGTSIGLLLRRAITSPFTTAPDTEDLSLEPATAPSGISYYDAGIWLGATPNR